MLKIDIISQDNDLLVINKPAGLIVNQSETTQEFTLQDWLIDYFKKNALDLDIDKKSWQNLVPVDFSYEFGTPQEIFEQRKGLVHRLDKNTSGVLVLAKNPGSLVNLMTQFKNRQINKRYVCLVHNKLRVKEGVITAAIGRSNVNRMKFVVKAEGRMAKTKYQLDQYFTKIDEEKIAVFFDNLTIGHGLTEKDFIKKAKIYQGFSLINCWPETGRTHQIRVHLKHWKHPLVGDSQYLGKKRAKLDVLWCKRHFLHAAELSFKHPRSNELVTYKAKLADDLCQVLSLLQI